MEKTYKTVTTERMETNEISPAITLLSTCRYFLFITTDGEIKHNSAVSLVKGQRWKNVKAELAIICRAKCHIFQCYARKNLRNLYGPIKIFI